MYGPFKGMSAANPKRVDFSLRDDRGNLLQGPGFVEDCSALWSDDSAFRAEAS